MYPMLGILLSWYAWHPCTYKRSGHCTVVLLTMGLAWSRNFKLALFAFGFDHQCKWSCTQTPPPPTVWVWDYNLQLCQEPPLCLYFLDLPLPQWGHHSWGLGEGSFVPEGHTVEGRQIHCGSCEVPYQPLLWDVWSGGGYEIRTWLVSTYIHLLPIQLQKLIVSM